MMTHAHAVTHTGDFQRRHASVFTDGLAATASAAAAADWHEAIVQASKVRDGGKWLHTSVVRDMLTAGVNWWRAGDLLSMHPQEAFERYGKHVDGLKSPAEQHPELAVMVTAGLAAEHDWDDRYGIDLEDLGETSLRREPSVRAVRDAANLLGEDFWVAVRLPGEFEGDGEAEEGAVVKQWTTVVVGEDELTWLKEALQLNASEETDTDDDGLDPLD